MGFIDYLDEQIERQKVGYSEIPEHISVNLNESLCDDIHLLSESGELFYEVSFKQIHSFQLKKIVENIEMIRSKGGKLIVKFKG